MDYQRAFNLAVKVAVVPYWETLDNRPLFRKYPTKKGPAYHVTRQSKEMLWAPLVEALGLTNSERVAAVRKLIIAKLRADGRLQ